MSTEFLSARPFQHSSREFGEEEEGRSLDILDEFKRLYEKKLQEIDRDGGGDCLELKNKVQQKWIEDLTEQTSMMAKVITELETEATDRVKKLEDKLQQSAKCACEVMKRYQMYDFSINSDESLQKIYYLENDVKSLLEFIKRIREDGRWSIDQLKFYEVSHQDLFGCCATKQNWHKQQFQPARCPEQGDKTPQIPEKDVALNNNQYELKRHEREEVGKIEELSREVKKKDAEFEALRQSMLDMRTALTEEVACKHDAISALRKDVQQLEERCLQADKQTAFKDDIIKELRKEIKQLKSQKEKLEEARMEVENDRNADAKMRAEIKEQKATIADLQTNLAISRERCNTAQSAAMAENNQPNGETICICNEDGPDPQGVPNDSSQFFQEVSLRESHLEEEIRKRQQEVEELRCKCEELENSLTNSQGRADNLQRAVDLYLNSISVLEASDQRAKIEMEQQRITIAQLQEALVGTKQALDEFREKSQQEMENHQQLINVLYVNLVDLEEKNRELSSNLSSVSEAYGLLQEANFDLEVEHLNSLQDLTNVETQLARYQTDFKVLEDTASRSATKSEVRKLKQQKRCYEQIVQHFKDEMAVMSEQLINLQEILNMSNQSCVEENNQLQTAVCELQNLNCRLHQQLNETEFKVAFESERLHKKDQQIDDLHKMVEQKNVELNLHDEVIAEMQTKMDAAILQNRELEGAMVQLQSKFRAAQEAERASQKKKNNSNKDDEDCCGCRQKVAMYQKSVAGIKSNMESSNEKYEKLLKDYNRTMEELSGIKQKHEEKARQWKRTLEDLKAKLNQSRGENESSGGKMASIQSAMAEMTQLQRAKEQELQQYKQIVIDFKKTLLDLNQTLTESELDNKVLMDEFNKNQGRMKESKDKEDIYRSCRCELALYKQLLDNFKSSFVEATRKLGDVSAENKKLRSQLHQQGAKLQELQRRIGDLEVRKTKLQKEMKVKEDNFGEVQRQFADIIMENAKLQKELKNTRKEHAAERACLCKEIKEHKARFEEGREMLEDQQRRDRESSEMCRDVCNRLKVSQEEQKRLNDLVNELRRDIDLKDQELESRKCQAQKRVAFDRTQEEIGALKEEIKKMIQAQVALNYENDKLLDQVSRQQRIVTSLQDINHTFEQQLDEKIAEVQSLKHTNEVVEKQKEDLVHELDCLQACYERLGKEHRSINDSFRNMERELLNTRSNCEDICAESRHVVGNVKAWLQEQKKVNGQVNQQTQGYCAAIGQLKNENRNLKNHTQQQQQQPWNVCPATVPRNRPKTPNCSVYAAGLDLPAVVPCTVDSCEWYMREHPSDDVLCDRSTCKWYVPEPPVDDDVMACDKTSCDYFSTAPNIRPPNVESACTKNACRAYTALPASNAAKCNNNRTNHPNNLREHPNTRNNCTNKCNENNNSMNQNSYWSPSAADKNNYYNSRNKYTISNNNPGGYGPRQAPQQVCYGSQGTLSPDNSFRDSPSSFVACSVDEWHAPNYREQEDDTDEFDEDFIKRIENLTDEARNNNKKLMGKCGECCVSKMSKS